MATTSPPSIAGLPAAPDPNDRSTFNTRAYPWSAALPAFGVEVSAVADNVKANADDAKLNADIAAAQAASALAAVGAVKWVSGTSYAQGAGVYSPITFQTYRRAIAGDGTTDPSLDTTNWRAISIATLQVNPVAALDIDCSLGNYFTKTIAGSSAFTFSNATAGSYAFTLELTHTSGTVTWPASVKWPADIAPTLTTGKTHLFIFLTDDAGTRWRGAAIADYVN